ncbi:MAG: VanZ family protein [Streptococcaceae bacterium]|jgi:VanZ family protein|nr:VanZ family protein [Streptococcaceae bacterium]MCH4176962.1 VanZ family protein [Streptococcaceae bacterium]
MKKKSLKNGNFWILIAVFMMLLLFYSSSQTYQQQSQIGTLGHLLKDEPFKETFGKINFCYANRQVSLSNLGYLSIVEFFIRKGAHFFSYFVIGMSLFLGFSKKYKSLIFSASLSIILATSYACLDEFHQMLTGGRTPLIQDVVLDFSGATSIVITLLIFKLIQRQKIYSADKK